MVECEQADERIEAVKMTDGTEVRPESSQLFPWYDSVWLNQYATAEAIIRRVRPEALPDFVDAFRVLRTRPDFEPPYSRAFGVAELSQFS